MHVSGTSPRVLCEPGARPETLVVRVLDGGERASAWRGARSADEPPSHQTPWLSRPHGRGLLLLIAAGLLVACNPADIEETQRTAGERVRQAAEETGRAVASEASRRASEAVADIQRRAGERAGEAISDVQRRAAERARDAITGRPVPDSPERGFAFTAAPVPLKDVTLINWYGNTELAYQCRETWFDEVQGLHSGVDFLVPVGTQITSRANVPGKVLAVNNQPRPYNYGAGPANVLVDHGTHLVLYGHTRPDGLPPLGAIIEPGDPVALSGTDPNGGAHLHLEVIRKYPGWDALPVGQRPPRPGDIRTNPVPFFSADLSEASKVPQGAFHPTTDNRWSTPADQPDIIPGGPYAVPLDRPRAGCPA